MKKSRAFTAIMAAASMTTLSAAFVGVLAAGPSLPGGVSGDGPAAPDSASAPEVPSGLPGNEVANLDVPTVSGKQVVFMTSGPDDDEDRDDVCHGLSGDTDLPGHNNQIQHPCQSDNNSVGEGELQIAGHDV